MNINYTVHDPTTCDSDLYASTASRLLEKGVVITGACCSVITFSLLHFISVSNTVSTHDRDVERKSSHITLKERL
jgi:hypothetical protein